MNKGLWLTGASALAMSVSMASVTKAQAADVVMPENGAYASINYSEPDGEGGGNPPPKPELLGGSVYNNGTSGAPTLDPGQVRPNEITDSFNGADGVGHVQQNEGSANSINAAAAVQASINQLTPAGSGLVSSHLVSSAIRSLGVTGMRV